MSTNARISLIGMYNYEPKLFDALLLPEGYDKETFINSLLLEHGEKCVMYSNPDFMRNAIGVWGKKWELELSKIYEALTAKYDPIYNYDRFEEIEDGRTKQYTSKVVGTRKATDKPDYTDNTTHNETDNATHNETNNATHNETNNRTLGGTETYTASDTNEHTVSADNSSAYQADSKDMIINNDQTTTNNTDNQTVNGTNNQTVNGTNNQTVNATNNRRVQGTTQDLNETTGTDTTDNEKETNKHTAHIYGNVGVTTSAQMVTEVLKQRFTYNLYATATRLFANELLIGIY